MVTPRTSPHLTAPCSLTDATGRLNPDAVGWTTQPMHNTDRIGHGRVGFGRNKRWEYWAVTTPDHVVALTVSSIDYAGVNNFWVLDRRTGQEINQDAVTPFGMGTTLPGSLDAGPTTFRSKSLTITITPEADGTRLQARGKRVDVDIVAALPEGHERLGVVVPWSDHLFQYTVKDVARPASGSLRIDGVEHRLGGGEAWATLDHGRGRWPRSITWNWGAGSGRCGAHEIGIQVGGKWTDGTGATENSLLIDGRLTKIDQLDWAYDQADWRVPWRVTGSGVDLTFAVEHVRHVATDLKVIRSRTWQCFGTWSGTVTDAGGQSYDVTDVFGWAEHVEQLW
ncbi:DUF2804 domain-containing protein [Flexivirga sp. B27]